MSDRMSFCSQVFIWSLLSGVVPWTMPPFFLGSWQKASPNTWWFSQYSFFSSCLYSGDIPMINISIPNWLSNNPPTKLAELENCQLRVTRGFDFCHFLWHKDFWGEFDDPKFARKSCAYIYIYIRINKLEDWELWFFASFFATSWKRTMVPAWIFLDSRTFKRLMNKPLLY